MTEYIEREALLKRIDGIWDCADMVFEPNDHCCRADDCASCKWWETKNAIRKIAANIPAADVRHVILCKDCWFFEKDTLFCSLHEADFAPHAFCSYATTDGHAEYWGIDKKDHDRKSREES